MGDFNKAILCGRLGRDAELRYTTNGAAVATLNLATTDVYKDRDGQKKEDTQWHRVVLWGKTAETLQDYLTKGKQILVEGKIQTRKWKDKDGNDRYTTEVRGDRVVLLGSSSNGDTRSHRPRGGHVSDEQVAHDEMAPQQQEIADDDVPF